MWWAPQKIMYLAADNFRGRGLLDSADVEFCTAGGVIFGVKKYAETLLQVCERYGIHLRYANVFALGDAAGTPNAKTGAAIRKQAPVGVENLLHQMASESLGGRYEGYGSCPLVTGYGKLVLAEFNYDNEPTETFPFDQGKERWSLYQLKKRVLPWLYRNKILKGTA